MRWIGLGVLVVVSLLLFEYTQIDRESPDYEPSETVIQKTPISETRVLFSGDVFLGRDVERRNTGEFLSRPLEIFQTFDDLDAVVINFEAPVPQVHSPTPDFGMQFSVSSNFLPALADVGITHVSLANNHTLDHGADGFTHTQQSFRAHDIEPFGHPSQLNLDSVSYIETPHHRVAIVGIHTLYGLPSDSDLDEIVGYARATADVAVVYIHWGEEYHLQHNGTQKQLAQTLVAAGADFIIGHHPHVVQGVDKIDDAVVFFSLGNTIFDQYFSIDVQEGLLVELVLRDKDAELLLHPITSVGSPTVPRLMTDTERTSWLTGLAGRSTDLLLEDISRGTIHAGRPLRND